MKAILEFTLPEETEVYNVHNKAIDMQCALISFAAYLRYESKHNDKLTDLQHDYLLVITEEFHQQMAINQVNDIL